MSSFIDIEAYGLVWHGRSGLAPGWKTSIAAIVQAARSRLAAGAVAGLFLGDEIVCGGVPVQNFSAVANFCRKELDSAGGHGLVYVNECKPSFTKADGIKGMLPAGLDIISFDSYELSNLSSFAPTPWWLQEPLENKVFARKEIIPKMHPHQRLMVVPGFYGNDTATAEQHAVQDDRLLAKLEAYWSWMRDEEKMVGLNPYHWDNTNACPPLPAKCTHMCYGGVCGPDGELFGRGAKNYPKLVSRMREIGAIIHGNNR